MSVVRYFASILCLLASTVVHAACTKDIRSEKAANKDGSSLHLMTTTGCAIKVVYEFGGVKKVVINTKIVGQTKFGFTDLNEDGYYEVAISQTCGVNCDHAIFKIDRETITAKPVFRADGSPPYRVKNIEGYFFTTDRIAGYGEYRHSAYKIFDYEQLEIDSHSSFTIHDHVDLKTDVRYCDISISKTEQASILVKQITKEFCPGDPVIRMGKK